MKSFFGGWGKCPNLGAIRAREEKKPLNSIDQGAAENRSKMCSVVKQRLAQGSFGVALRQRPRKVSGLGLSKEAFGAFSHLIWAIESRDFASKDAIDVKSTRIPENVLSKSPDGSELNIDEL